MINRSQSAKSLPINIVGSSVFGRYPKINIEKTYNMFISDNWMVDYAGYDIAIPATDFGNAVVGRGIYASTNFQRLVCVLDNRVYLVNIIFDQYNARVTFSQAVQIGTLQTATGDVSIAENNKAQIAISDNTQIYIYDPTQTPPFQLATRDMTNPLSFTPGRIDFHDSRFVVAATNDMFNPVNPGEILNNTWRLSVINNGLLWPDDSPYVGVILTKPDITQAVVRVPSHGNMVFVFGKTVCEPWFDIGAPLFPYQRNTSGNIDYGCLNPATIATLDELVVWLGVNEKSGPIILASDGGAPKKISTDGIDYVFSNLQNPQDSQAFLYRQDGHIFYHINFYSDNLSLFYDFNTNKFYHASDENLNYFIGGTIAFFNNQYYFLTKNNGNLYAFDTIFTQYVKQDIPRIRTCKNMRLPTQEYFVINDLGFFIETGETPNQYEHCSDIFLITEDGKFIVTEGDAILFVTEDDQMLLTQDDNLIAMQNNDNTFAYLISEQDETCVVKPRVDLSISYDGGYQFSSYMPYELPGLGLRQNKLIWWQLGIANDAVVQFRFNGIGRFVASDGMVNIRQ